MILNPRIIKKFSNVKDFEVLAPKVSYDYAKLCSSEFRMLKIDADNFIKKISQQIKKPETKEEFSALYKSIMEKRKIASPKQICDYLSEGDLVNLINYHKLDFNRVIELSCVDGKRDQYSEWDIRRLAGMSNNNYEKAKKRDLFKNYYTYEIIMLADLNEKYLAKAKKILNLKKEGEKLFDVKSITTIFDYQDKGFSQNPNDSSRLRKMLNLYQQHLDKDTLSKIEQAGINIDELSKKIDARLDKIITPMSVSKESRTKFFKNFLANNNPEMENTIKNANFEIFGKKGLPLKYPRAEFINDLDNITKNSSLSEKKDLFNYFEMIPKFDESGRFISYEGFPLQDESLADTPLKKDFLGKIIEFTRKNEVITSDKKLNKILNSLLDGYPEFVNIIGKKQDDKNHILSVDLHILKVFKEFMKNPEYKKLSDNDKTVSKFMILNHDIAKPEGLIDKFHQNVSAFYVRDLLKRYNFPIETKNRIIELINNHHWLEEFNIGKVSLQETAARFRRPNDFLIAKIFAEADLKGVSEKFYDRFSESLSPARLKKIEEAVDSIHETGNVLITSRIVNQSKVPKVEYNGKTYKVINLAELEDSQDMGEFGFVQGLKKEDLRFAGHFLPLRNLYENLQGAYALSDASRSGCLSFSLLSPKNNKTYDLSSYGLGIEVENVNIATMSNQNQSSGGLKTFDYFVNNLKPSYFGNTRKFFRTFLRQQTYEFKPLGILNSAYSDFYKKIANKKHLSQIGNVEIDKFGQISIDKQIINGKILQKAIPKAQDALFIKGELNDVNEIVAYNPNFPFVLCKRETMNKVNPEILDFAHEKDLPIILMGY